MKATRFLAGAAIAAAMWSCAGHTPEMVTSSLDTADTYLADGDIAEARRTADAIYSGDSTVMTASQFGRLALIYMQISDNSDDPTTVGQAIHCYRMGCHANADSLAAYFSSLPVELDPYAIMLTEIVHRLETPKVIPPDEPVDSIEPAAIPEEY